MLRERDNNCISLVLSHFGVIEEDKYVSPIYAIRMMEPWFKDAEREEAQVLMVYHPTTIHVEHLALMVPEDRSLVIHRPGCGAKIRKDALDIALGPYQQEIDRDYYKILFLRFLGECPPQLPRVRRSASSFLPRFLRRSFIGLQRYYGEPYSF